VAGTVLTYVGLGIGAALGGGAVGTIFANPLVMGAIALVFLVLALASARVFSFADFSGFRTFISKRQRAGFLWAFIFGTVMGVIVAPCVGPLLVAILTLIASGQDVVRGGLLMLSFGLGMGVLFLLLGASGGMIRRFLRPGKFSEAVSVVFGIFFVAAGLFYLKGIVPWKGFFGLLGLS
jgi:thiol:disulfide interchange protein DsbD